MSDAPSEPLFEGIVRRCRFAGVVPEAVRSLASSEDGALVAVLRHGGSVEVYNVIEKWRLLALVTGLRGSQLATLCWSRVGTPRLFGGSRSGVLVEVDLKTLTFVGAMDSFGGAVHNVASSPTSESLVAACEDGALRVFAWEGDAGRLHLQVAMPPGAERMLSAAWSADGLRLFGGCADGTIRCYDVALRRDLFRMTVENYGGEATIVWALLVLRDDTVVSADSLGHVQFWDGRTGTLSQTVSKHSADVLALCTTRDESCVFAAGVDSKVICIERSIPNTSGDLGAGGKRFTYCYSHRPHTHDVHGLVCCGGSKQVPELVCSAGVDTKMCTYRVQGFSQYRPKRLSPFGVRSLCSFAKEPSGDSGGSKDKKDLILVQHDTRLELWRLHAKERELLVRLRPYGQHALRAATLSPDGKRIAASDTLSTKLYELRRRGGNGNLEVEKCFLEKDQRTPASCLAFALDGRLLVSAGMDGRIRVFGLEKGTTKATQLAVLELPNENIGAVVSHLAVSQDGQWLSVATGSKVHIYAMDSFAHFWTLPGFAHDVTALDLHPNSIEVFVATAENRVHVAQIEQKRFSAWTRALRSQTPGQLLSRPECINGFSFDPLSSSKFVAFSQGFACFIDRDKDIPTNARVVAHDGTDVADRRGRKRPRTESDLGVRQDEASTKKMVTLDNFVIDLRHRNVLGFKWTDANEITVVESSWLQVMRSLPDALYRARFGT